MNTVLICRKTLEYALSTILETEYYISDSDGKFCASGIDVPELMRDLFSSHIYSMNIMSGGPLIIVSRRASDNDQEDQVRNILLRYCIDEGLLQSNWVHHHQYRLHQPSDVSI